MANLNDIAGRFELVLELFAAGMFCNCNQWDEIEDDCGCITKHLRHKPRCIGQLKARELIDNPDLEVEQ